MINVLKNCSLFNSIPILEIESLFRTIVYKTKEFKSGEIIAFQDEKVENLLIVFEGTVRGEMIDFSGKTIVIEELVSPRPLAPAFLFGNSNYYPVNIVAQTNAKVLIIPKSEFVKMMQDSDKLLINFMNNISGRAQFLSRKIKFLSFHTIKGKFSFYTLSLIKNKDTVSVELPLSQAKLAELFGVARPSLARAIREMHNDNIIRAEAKTIKILDMAALHELMK